MATAKATTQTVTITEAVTLNLSLEEARTLLAISYRTGGDPQHSPRKHVAAIGSAIGVALGLAPSRTAENPLITQGLRFKDYE